MSSRAADPGQPLVAVICRFPILYEALVEAFEGVATVRSFPASRGDTAGLLRWLEPDAIVVDSEEEAALATPFARESRSPLLHVSLRERKLRVLRNGGWEEAEETATPDAIRNIVVGGIFGRRRRRR